MLAGVLLPTGVLAQGISDHDYCLIAARAERMECRAEGMIRRAGCIDGFAFGQWIDDADAALEYNLCLLETKQYVLECLEHDITDCTTW